jgi:predicted  nucleic acid-binding Zn-ribbon protein
MSTADMGNEQSRQDVSRPAQAPTPGENHDAAQGGNQHQIASPRRPASRRSSSKNETPPPQHGSSGQREFQTPSNKSSRQQSADPGNNVGDSFSLASRTSPDYFPTHFQDDTSSAGSDDPEDPCLKIRHGRRKLRRVLKDLQEMHQESIRQRIALEEEIRQLTNETSALQDYNNDLQRSASRWRDLATEQGELYDDCEAQLETQLVTNRESATQLQDLWNEIQDLRETNGDPQNENADLRRQNCNFRQQAQRLREDRQAAFGEIDRLRTQVPHLQEQLQGTEDAEAEAEYLRDQIQDAAAAAHENALLREQLEDMNVELHETYAHLDRANNEVIRLHDEFTQLQTASDWLYQDDPDIARPDSRSGSSAGSTPRSSSASRSTPSSGRDETPDSSPSPPRPRGGRNVRAAAAPSRRMNTRSQVADDTNPRTPPPELFSPRRARSARRACAQQNNAVKPAGMSKAVRKRRGRK